MDIFSFDTKIDSSKIKRDPNQDNLFDLFQKNIISKNNIPFLAYVVPREYEMRLDRVSEHLYGTSQYMEELMVINDILNPYSIKEGQYIYFCDSKYLGNLYAKDELSDINKETRKNLIDSSQTSRESKRTENDNNLPVTIKPSNLEQIKVSDDYNVQIINSFE